MNLKKWLTTLGVTSVLFGSLLAGCSSGNESAEKKDNGAKQGEKVEIFYS
jgi:multiple sugar transport system substrate-binding protein